MNRMMGRGRDAFTQIEQYIKNTVEGKTDWEAFKILGDLHYENTYYIQARQKYQRAGVLNPNEPSIYIGLARARMKLAQRQGAIEAAKMAVTLDAMSAEAHEGDRGHDLELALAVGARDDAAVDQRLLHQGRNDVCAAVAGYEFTHAFSL